MFYKINAHCMLRKLHVQNVGGPCIWMFAVCEESALTTKYHTAHGSSQLLVFVCMYKRTDRGINTYLTPGYTDKRVWEYEWAFGKSVGIWKECMAWRVPRRKKLGFKRWSRQTLGGLELQGFPWASRTVRCRLKDGKTSMKVGKLSRDLLGRNRELRGTKWIAWLAFRKPLSTGWGIGVL